MAATLLAHSDAVCSVAFSRDGTGIATGSADGTAVVWRDKGGVPNATWSDDREAFSVGEAELWQPEATLGARHRDPLVMGLAWSPGGRRVLSLDRLGASRVWAPREAEPPKPPEASDAENVSFLGCFDEFQFVSKVYYGNEAAVNFQHMAEQARTNGKAYFAMARHEAEFGHAYTVERIVGSPRYGSAACGSACSDAASRWCGCANEDSWRYPHTETRNSDCPSGLRIMATYEVRLPPTASETWVEPDPQVSEDAEEANASNGSDNVSFNGSAGAEGDRPERSEVPSRAPDLPPWTLRSEFRGEGDAAWAVQWLPARPAKVLVGAHDRTACIWGPEAPRATLVSCSGVASDSRAHGSTLQTSTYSRYGAIWQHEDAEPPSTWTLAAYLEAGPHLVSAARWSPDGTRIMTGGNDGMARIWQLGGPDVHMSGRPRWDIVTSCQAHVQAVWAVAWSPDGGRVVTGSKDGSMRVWRPRAKLPAQWEEPVTLDEFPGDVPSDVTGSANGTVEEAQRKGYAWDLLADLNERSTMDWVSPWSPATVADWSPDGHSVLTGSEDGTVRVWQESAADAKQWQVVATLKGHTGRVWAATWSLDGSRILTGGHDGSARLWRLLDSGAAPEESVAASRAARSCEFVRYQGHRCAGLRGPVMDMVEDYLGTLEACRKQCCFMGEACAGFEVVGGSAEEEGPHDPEALPEEVARCSFRAGALQEPEAWMGQPRRDCYLHVHASANRPHLGPGSDSGP